MDQFPGDHSQPHLRARGHPIGFKAIGIDDGDFVQATCFSSRRVVKVDHSGSTRQGSTWEGLQRECASGSLRDGQAACQDTPADLMHTLPASKKRGRDTRHKADAQHDTVTSPQHEHVTQLCTSFVSTSRRASVITRDIVHSYIHSFIHSYIHTFIHSHIHTIHSQIHTFIHSHRHTPIQTYIHTDIHRLRWSPRVAIRVHVSTNTVALRIVHTVFFLRHQVASNESRERFFFQVSPSLCFPAHRYKRSQRRSEDAGPSRFVWPSFQSFQTGLAHSFLCFLCPIVQYGPVHFCFRHEAWPTQLMRRHNKDACPGVLTTT